MQITAQAAAACPRHAGRRIYDLLAFCTGNHRAVEASVDELQLADRLGFVTARTGEQKRTCTLVHDGTFAWLDLHPCIDCAAEISLRMDVAVQCTYTLSRARTTRVHIAALRRAPAEAREPRQTVGIRITGAAGQLDMVVELVDAMAPTGPRATGKTESWKPIGS